MKHQLSAIKWYRVTGWTALGLPLLFIICYIILLEIDSHYDLGNSFNSIIDYTLPYLIPLTYTFMMIWCWLSTDWWLRNRSKTKINNDDRLLWGFTLTVLIIFIYISSQITH